MFELVISLFRIKIELKSRLLHINQSMHMTSNIVNLRCRLMQAKTLKSFIWIGTFSDLTKKLPLLKQSSDMILL